MGFLQATYSYLLIAADTPRCKVAATRTGFPVRRYLTDGQRIVTEYLYRRRQLVSTRVVEVLAKSFLPGVKTIHAMGFQCGILQDGIPWAWDL